LLYSGEMLTVFYVEIWCVDLGQARDGRSGK